MIIPFELGISLPKAASSWGPGTTEISALKAFRFLSVPQTTLKISSSGSELEFNRHLGLHISVVMRHPRLQKNATFPTRRFPPSPVICFVPVSESTLQWVYRKRHAIAMTTLTTTVNWAANSVITKIFPTALTNSMAPQIPEVWLYSNTIKQGQWQRKMTLGTVPAFDSLERNPLDTPTLHA